MSLMARVNVFLTQESANVATRNSLKLLQSISAENGFQPEFLDENRLAEDECEECLPKTEEIKCWRPGPLEDNLPMD